jgi:RNA polymerase sigma factor (sigma-70 family)
MLRLIATLPARQRAVIALRFYEDMSVDQIADMLGCRTVTVRTHLSRALATLRTALPASLVTTGEQP